MAAAATLGVVPTEQTARVPRKASQLQPSLDKTSGELKTMVSALSGDCPK